VVLYDPRVVDGPREWVSAWRPPVPGVHEVFHARFVEHAYPAHIHDTWTVFVVEDGAIRYDLEARHRGVADARVTILPPHVVHDGRAATTDGYRKRVLYLDAEALGERLIGPAVDRPDVPDRGAVTEVRRLDRLLRTPGAALEAETALLSLCDRLRVHLGDRATEALDRPAEGVAADLRDLLDARRFAGITLAEAGGLLHVSPAHLARCFTRTFGIAPHQYLVGRRIEEARHRLLDGEPPALVAASVGFHDQAHMTRHFRRHVGTTPGRYASSGSRRGD
jgi:AraC-like DNA-binding protein